MSNEHIYKPISASLCLALCLLLPFLTGQIPDIGSMLSPMHIPVLLCAFICGPVYAGAVGLTAPVLRSLLFGMPYLFPTAVTMSPELAAYGIIAGSLYHFLPKKVYSIYLSLILAIIGGRLVWGCAAALFYPIDGIPFGFEAFLAGALSEAWPGIILHTVLIPPLVIALNKLRRTH